MIDTINQIVDYAVERDLLHQFTQNTHLHTASVNLNGQDLVNFGSCSYMGLEFHPAIKAGVIDAVQRYGSQFSSSRTYASLGLYQDLESGLEQIFGKPVIVSPSTTMGHLGTLQVIVRKSDAVIVDFLAHGSLQMTAQLLKSMGIAVHMVPHNSIDHLETKIKHLRGKHARIWYLADGIYSMHGDLAPVREIERLLNQYKQFHAYIDDAHGMSWMGQNGCGFVRSQIAHHEKLVLAVSLNKSMASGGGAIVFPNAEMRRDVRHAARPLIFSGPLQPPMLGAAVASVKLHLAPEIAAMQQELREKVAHCNATMRRLNIPQYEETDTAIFFVPVGLQESTCHIAERLKEQGFYVNVAGFPAVPMNKCGIRFMINRLHTAEQIERMLEALQAAYHWGLEKEGSDIHAVAKAFRMDLSHITKPQPAPALISGEHLKVELHDSIAAFSPTEWDAHFKDKGNLLHDNLASIEAIFSGNTQPENNWTIYYLAVRDRSDNIVLLTHFSCLIAMDDMLADEGVSGKVRAERAEDRYFLTSKVVMSGTLFTKGGSVFIDFAHPSWQSAMRLMMDQMKTIAEKENASRVMVREFDGPQHAQLKDFMLKSNFVTAQLPENFYVDQLDWMHLGEYLQTMPGRYRYRLRRDVLARMDAFHVVTEKPQTEEEMRACYKLYQAVYNRARSISVFPLPYALFEWMVQHDQYDIIRLYLKDRPLQPAAVMWSYRNGGTYNALIVGLDYGLVEEHLIYPQILFQTILRARSLNCKTLDLGYTARLQKKSVGARHREAHFYVMTMDHYSHAVMELLA